MYGRFLVLMLFTFILSGCMNGKYDPSLSIGEQIKTRHYDHNAKEFGKNELLDEILEAAADRDVGRINALFSDYAIEQDESLNEEIELLVKSFPQVSELKNRGCSEFASHNRGSSRYNNLYEPVVQIIDDKGDKYWLICMWIEGDSENPKKQGVHSLQLISEEMYSKHKYTIHSKDDEPGAYVYVSE